MMFVGGPIPDIQTTNLNHLVLLSFFQDAFAEGALTKPREKGQNIKLGHDASFQLAVIGQQFSVFRFSVLFWIRPLEKTLCLTAA